MNTRMHVLYYLSKKRINSRGLAPIYCRITILGDRSEFSTGIVIEERYWKNNQVSPDHPQSIVYNARISAISTRLFSIQLNMALTGEQVTAEAVRSSFIVKAEKKLAFAEILNMMVVDKETDPTAAAATKKNYRVRRNNLFSFLRKIRRLNITAPEITLDFCKKFEQYGRAQGFTYNYINKHIYFIGTALKIATRRKIITHNVVDTYEFTYDADKQIISLSNNELELLEGYKFRSATLNKTSFWFLLQCYSGLAYCDLETFVSDPHKYIFNIDGMDWIIINRGKTGTQSVIPLFPKIRALLSSIHDHQPLMSNQKYNQYIKEVAQVIGIEKNLTSHIARKTFATHRINEGWSFPAVMLMLGHSSIKTTQKSYAQVNHILLVKELFALGYKAA